MAWNKLFYFLLLLEIIHMIALGHFLEMEPERERAAYVVCWEDELGEKSCEEVRETE